MGAGGEWGETLRTREKGLLGWRERDTDHRRPESALSAHRLAGPGWEGEGWTRVAPTSLSLSLSPQPWCTCGYVPTLSSSARCVHQCFRHLQGMAPPFGRTGWSCLSHSSLFSLMSLQPSAWMPPVSSVSPNRNCHVDLVLKHLFTVFTVSLSLHLSRHHS